MISDYLIELGDWLRGRRTELDVLDQAALAAGTGGECELVSPREGMADRIVRHFERMRAPRANRVSVRWPDGDPHRVLRAPDSGTLFAVAEIGDHVKEGQLIAEIQNTAGNRSKVTSPFDGLLRGLIHPRVEITEGMNIGDVDARNDPST